MICDLCDRPMFLGKTMFKEFYECFDCGKRVFFEPDFREVHSFEDLIDTTTVDGD